jgi:YD repeat-containing protein
LVLLDKFRHRHELFYLPDAVTLDYDAARRVIGATDYSDNTTHYAYDARNNLAHVTDVHGGRTEYAYESINVRIVQPDYAEERFAYDLLDRLIAEQGFGGRRTGYPTADPSTLPK